MENEKELKFNNEILQKSFLSFYLALREVEEREKGKITINLLGDNGEEIPVSPEQFYQIGKKLLWNED